MESYQEKANTLVERFGISPVAAMKALEESDGDILDAVIRLEAEGVIKRTSANYKTAGEFVPPINEKKISDKRSSVFAKISGFFKNAMASDLYVTRNKKILCSMPLLIFLVILLFASKFVIAAVIISLFAGCRYHIESGGRIGGTDKINETLGKVSDEAEQIKNTAKNSFRSGGKDIY